MKPDRPTRPNLAARPALGRHAEDLAAGHLQRLGFTIVARNARHGRLEIDLIAQRGSLVVFCEVRSRSGDRWMSPAHTITPAKQARVRRAAHGWLRSAGLPRVAVRFDVACIVFEAGSARLEYYERAFV